MMSKLSANFTLTTFWENTNVAVDLKKKHYIKFYIPVFN